MVASTPRSVSWVPSSVLAPVVGPQRVERPADGYAVSLPFDWEHADARSIKTDGTEDEWWDREMVDPVRLASGRYRAPEAPGMSAAFTDAVNTFYGRGAIPIGVCRSGVTPEAGKFNVLAAKKDNGQLRYPHDLLSGKDAPDAVQVLRKSLAAAEDQDGRHAVDAVVGGHLGPAGRDLSVGHLEHDGAVGIADPGVSTTPLNRLVGIFSLCREATFDAQTLRHCFLPAVPGSVLVGNSCQQIYPHPQHLGVGKRRRP